MSQRRKRGAEPAGPACAANEVFSVDAQRSFYRRTSSTGFLMSQDRPGVSYSVSSGANECPSSSDQRVVAQELDVDRTQRFPCFSRHVQFIGHTDSAPPTTKPQIRSYSCCCCGHVETHCRRTTAQRTIDCAATPLRRLLWSSVDAIVARAQSSTALKPIRKTHHRF